MRIACVILAAGAGTRMGGVAKALLRRGDKTFLERIIETARAEGVRDGDVVVVVGPPFGDAVAMYARGLGVHVVVNDDPSRGMASSIALGFAALLDDTRHGSSGRQDAKAPREETGEGTHVHSTDPSSLGTLASWRPIPERDAMVVPQGDAMVDGAPSAVPTDPSSLGGLAPWRPIPERDAMVDVAGDAMVDGAPSAVLTDPSSLGGLAPWRPIPERDGMVDVAGDADAAWLWPVDHPDVLPSTLRALREAIGEHEVAQPRCEGRGGHPPLIARRVWPRLVACTNARDVISAADVVRVEVEDRGTVEDVDR